MFRFGGTKEYAWGGNGPTLNRRPARRRRSSILMISVAATLICFGISRPVASAADVTAQLSFIASNFDTTPFIVAGNNGGNPPADESGYGYWGTGDSRFVCQVSHYSYDDPIVFPGQPGASHLHMFFGNTAAAAASTYETLRTSGGGTCSGGPVNRSAYWTPAVLNASGAVEVPDFINLYYKTADQRTTDIVSPAAGLRMVAGASMSDPTAADSHRWYCELDQSATGKTLTIPDCPTGQALVVSVSFPTCWDGTHLDAPDHRSHLAVAVRDANDHRVCPTGYPVHLPEVTFVLGFQHGTAATSGWYAASDRMPGMSHPNGSTFHADWIGAWDPPTMDRIVVNCLRGMRDCQDGQLGDGFSLVHPAPYTGPATFPPAAPPPSDAAPTTTVTSTTVSPTTSLVPPTTATTAPSPTVQRYTRATWIPLTLGSTGEYVRRAQTTLRRIGYRKVVVTSVVDRATVDAVLAEQKKVKLSATGTIDWDTGVHLGIFWPTDG